MMDLLDLLAQKNAEVAAAPIETKKEEGADTEVKKEENIAKEETPVETKNIQEEEAKDDNNVDTDIVNDEENNDDENNDDDETNEKDEEDKQAEETNDVMLEILKGTTKNDKNKNQKKGKSTPSKPVEKPYEGPREVMVYGQVLFIEHDPKVTNEEIRKRVVDDYQRREFSAERTVFSLDKETGILCLNIGNFKPKG